MQFYDLIIKKKNGQRLDKDEIKFIVSEYTDGTIPDYQMSAFLMAAFIKGLDVDETINLTKSMTESGKIIDLSDIPGPKIDKHSTGGVGDGTSLVIAPLCASVGIIVPMMSGRGLGHTGGTLDKLESIPGFKTDLTEAQYKNQLKKIGVSMIGQTKDVAPADKKMYALRDATATVDSVSFIAASIMSKKLAEGCDGLVLDVKLGSGAFMKSIEDARFLAKTIINIARANNKKVKVLITDMNKPLGQNIGNALEIEQAIQVLKGEGPKDFVNLVIELGARMVNMAGITKDLNQAKSLLNKNLKNGKALDKFQRLVEYQGGDAKIIENSKKVLPKAKNKTDILASNTGYINKINTSEVGMSAVLLSAGRLKKEDSIEPGAGIILNKNLGDKIERNELLASFYYNDKTNVNIAKQRFLDSFLIENERKVIPPLIYEEL